ncbi:hypothetical protein GOC67_12900 [Sinorhizobium medicae]|nr:hypothetical protein [Sinorhizobium medicae]MDX1175743.1 hypothetical protein [Sinorhizobium medicae]
MKRRHVLGALGGSLFMAKTRSTFAQNFEQFDAKLAALEPDELLATASAREIQFRQVIVVESQGASRRMRSESRISGRAKDLIIRFEVSGEQYYKQKLVHPIWPKGDSGITVGIGYDVGYMTAQTVRGDWDGILQVNTIERLVPAVGKKGVAAKNILPNFSDIEVQWEEALRQFDVFLPYIVAETEAVFPNTGFLNADCRGALVSLVYNRGGLISGADRRREMLNIRNHMASKSFGNIPEEFRSMKRLWVNKGLPGLLERRDLEALLFERGLEAG